MKYGLRHSRRGVRDNLDYVFIHSISGVSQLTKFNVPIMRAKWSRTGGVLVSWHFEVF